MQTRGNQHEECALPDLLGKGSEEVGVIDVRIHPTAQHIQGALRVPGGYRGLDDRFSWLPPPANKSKKTFGKPRNRRRLIILCEEEEKDLIREALSRWDVVGLVTDDNTQFWCSARSAGIVSPESGTPKILFDPSPLLSVIVQSVCKRLDSNTRHATILDLGCGAGRDLAWIVRNSNDKLSWLATGLDNLHSVVRRALLLRSEMNLDVGDAKIENIVWAQSTREGSLEALAMDSAQRSRGVPIPIPHNDKQKPVLESFASRHLPHKTYDVILLVRFFPLLLIPNLYQLTQVKSLIAISHFTTIVWDRDQLPTHEKETLPSSYLSPSPEKRFEAHHIESFLEVWKAAGTDWKIIHHVIEACEDGRPLRNVIFERIR